MNLDRIQEEAYNTYLQYQDYCDNVGIGLAYDYDMLKSEILRNHNRVISFNSKKMLYTTYIDNKRRISCKTKEGLQDKIIMHYIQNCSGLYYFGNVFERALLFNQEHDYLAPSSIDRYRVDYMKYIFPSPIFDQDIRVITEADMIKFFSGIMDDKPTAKCVSNIKTVIRLVFSYARVQEGLECLRVNTVFSNMRFPQRAFATKKTTENRVFKDDHISKVFEFLRDDNEIDLGIKLCFHTGVRVGELSALKAEDFCLDKRELRIQRAESVSGYGKNRVYTDTAPKCYKERVIILSDKAIEIARILLLATPTGFLFPDQDGHKHSHRFNDRLRRLCKKIDIPVFSMHDIRRTFASKMIDAGCTEKFVQDQMGHSDIRTTRQYYYYSTQHVNDYIRMANMSAI